ncbi:hypothetical protein QUF63_09035 [Anaerolineales bacterium HSG25]|nr:hypothetical protein [Anaerolineales bacterium HSG25]
MTPTIQNPSGLELPPNTSAVLQQMFRGYQWIVIDNEFGGGRSGSRVFLIKPIKNQRYSELPSVVKMASIGLVTKEWVAYQAYVRDKLPRSAKIKDEPTCPPDTSWGGLRYEMVGDGTFDIAPLSDYIQQAEVFQLRSVINQLLKAMSELWSLNWVHPGFPLQATYDPVLPANLLIEPLKPQTISDDVTPIAVNPDTVSHLSHLQYGDYVRLDGFVVTKVDLLQQTVTLNLPKQTHDKGSGLRTNSYYVRLRAVNEIGMYRFDEPIEPLVGVVVETRHERLLNTVEQILPADTDLEALELKPVDDTSHLPNPLLKLPEILKKVRRIRISTLHGDFNLGNILVDQTTSYIHLIDFSEAREDYTLHDFLRLETEIITHIVAEVIEQNQLPPTATIRNFYEQLYQVTVYRASFIPSLPHADLVQPFALLTEIRRAVHHYLFKYDDYSEYYEGLTVYLLGALKFRNLPPVRKQVAFWGAAVTQRLLVEPPAALLQPRLEISQPLRFQSAILLLILLLLVSIALAWRWQTTLTEPAIADNPPIEIISTPSKETAPAIVPPSPTNTDTPSVTPQPTNTPSDTPSATPQPTDTPSATPQPTDTPSVTPSPTKPPTETPTILSPVSVTTALSPTVELSIPQTAPQLVSPNIETNVTLNEATFSWLWEGGQLPETLAFELRIWKEGEAHFGAYDARQVARKPNAKGEYTLTFPVSSAHGVRQNGIYLWTVAIVQIEPEYKDLEIEAEPRFLQINVFDNGGQSSDNGNDDSGPPHPPKQ